jgi:hypothetical protein
MSTNKALGEAIGTTLALSLGFLFLPTSFALVRDLIGPITGIHIQIFFLGTYFSLVNIFDAPLVILYWALIAIIVGFIAGKKWAGALTAFSVWGTIAILGIVSISNVLPAFLEMDMNDLLLIIPQDFSLLTIMKLPLLDEFLNFFQDMMELLFSYGGINFKSFFALIWIFFWNFGLNLLMIWVITIGFGFLGGFLHERLLPEKGEGEEGEAAYPPDMDGSSTVYPYTAEVEDEDQPQRGTIDEEYPSWDDYINDSSAVFKRNALRKTVSFLLIGIVITSMLFGGVALGKYSTTKNSHSLKSYNRESLLSITNSIKPTISPETFLQKKVFSYFPDDYLSPSVSTSYKEDLTYRIKKDGTLRASAYFNGTDELFTDPSISAINNSLLIMLMFSKGDFPAEENPFYDILGDGVSLLSDLTLMVLYPDSLSVDDKTRREWGQTIAHQIEEIFSLNLDLIIQQALFQGVDTLLYGTEKLTLDNFLEQLKIQVLETDQEDSLASVINPTKMSARNATLGLMIMKGPEEYETATWPAVAIKTISYDAFTRDSFTGTFSITDFEDYPLSTISKHPNAVSSRINVVLPEGSSAPTDYEPINGKYHLANKTFEVVLSDSSAFPTGSISEVWLDFSYEFPVDVDIYREIESTNIPVGKRALITLRVTNHDSTSTATNIKMVDEFGKIYKSTGVLQSSLEDNPSEYNVSVSDDGVVKCRIDNLAPGTTKEITYKIELRNPGRYILPKPKLNYSLVYMVGVQSDTNIRQSIVTKYQVGEWIVRFLQFYWFMVVIVFVFAMIDFLYWIAKEKR